MNQMLAHIRCFVACLIFSFLVINVQANDKDVFDRKVRISKNKGTVYEFLKDISEQTDFLFIYDSQIINNDRIIKIQKGEYTLRDAIYLITGDRRLSMDLLGEHILLRLPEKQKPDDVKIAVSPPSKTHITIGGKLFDCQTEEPVLSASVGLVNTTIGTITNQDGEFQLMIPDSLLHAKVRFSHIGYESREMEIALLEGQHVDLALNPQVVSLQEVIVRAVSPMQVLSDMLNHRSVNYASDPVYLTTFYREGIDNRQKNFDLTESVLQIYKTGYQNPSSADQVKLIKMRRIVNRQQTDTIYPKMKSGVNSCLILDIIKELPDFLDPQDGYSYMYAHTGMNVIDGRLVDVIYFEQKEYIHEPLYTGELFIETESKALAEIRFELNPRLINKATHMFVDRKTANLKIDLQQAKYLVTYKPADDGTYYVNHIRGDITLKVRKKRRWFSAPIHFWFEMVTCKIDTEQVHSFSRTERLSPTRIFSETKHGYDKEFWENFNIILPEEELKDAIIKNLNEVLVTE
jgi:hypothetical protein